MNPPDPVINLRIISLAGGAGCFPPTPPALNRAWGAGLRSCRPGSQRPPSPERRRLQRSFHQPSQRQLDSLY